MKSKPLVGIIDISINNILSIKRAFENIGSKVTIIDEQKNIEKFDIIVLPGVGGLSYFAFVQSVPLCARSTPC